MSTAPPTGTAAASAPPPALSLHDAAQAFGAALSPEPVEKQAGVEEQPGAEAQDESVNDAASTQETLETAPADESGDEATASADEQSKEGTEGEEEQQQAAATETEFTVKIDGKDVTVSRDELLAGYSRTSDYTRKTQKLSADRKAFEGEISAVSAERAEYANLLPKLRAALEAGMQEPDWEALRAEDPARATLEWQRFQDRKAKIAGIQAQEQKTQQRIAQERQRAQEQIAAEQNTLLLEALPSWRDRKVRDAEAAEIAEAMQAVGFSGDELKVFDHRALLLIRKAAKFDKIEAERKKAAEKLRPQTQKVLKPGVAVRKNPDSEKLKSAKSQLKKTGSRDAAAQVFASMFDPKK